MEVEAAIRTRRTHKAFTDQPIDRDQLDQLLELASWAPNHHLSAPWRFRVLGPLALARLKQIAAAQDAAKLERCKTLVVVSCELGGDPTRDEEDLHATAIAAYIILLAAHSRGLAGYWRTPALLRTKAGQRAVGLEDTERFVGLIHLGYPRQRQPPPERPPLAARITYLD